MICPQLADKLAREEAESISTPVPGSGEMDVVAGKSCGGACSCQSVTSCVDSTTADLKVLPVAGCEDELNKLQLDRRKPTVADIDF